MKDTAFETDLLGLISGIFKRDLNEGIQTVPLSFKLLFKNATYSLLVFLISQFNAMMQTLNRKFESKGDLADRMPFQPKIRNFIQQMYHSLSDISILL